MFLGPDGRVAGTAAGLSAGRRSSAGPAVNGELLIRLDPLTASRRTQALAALCGQFTAAGACYPGTDLVLRYEAKSHPNPA